MLLDIAIDSRMRIKTITYSDLSRKPCPFHCHGLLHSTIILKGIKLPFLKQELKLAVSTYEGVL
jgi:hypothetical protein